MFAAATRAIGIIASYSLPGAAAVSLAFPELLPAEHRTFSVTCLTTGALLAGILGVNNAPKVRLGLCLFAVAVMVGWWVTPERDAVALRHFSGIGLGVMTAGLVARWCSTEHRLVALTVLFALAATGVLLRGSASALNSSLAAPASQLLAPQFDAIPLPLPGTELSQGHVNTNALGGTAVMVLPASVGLAVAALFVTLKRLRGLALVSGTGAGIIAAGLVLMTVSRSALGAAVLTSVTLALRWRRGRRWLLVALLLVAGGIAYGSYTWRHSAPEKFDRSLSDSVKIRLAILQDGFDRFRQSPWLGIGISQFRSGPRASLLGDNEVPHVHNIVLQVALDIGLLGLTGYVWTFGLILLMADRAAASPSAAGRIAAGAGLSLVAVHIFGLADAIALGSKVGVFQWWCAGLIIAASRLAAQTPGHRSKRAPAPLTHP